MLACRSHRRDVVSRSAYLTQPIHKVRVNSHTQPASLAPFLALVLRPLAGVLFPTNDRSSGRHRPHRLYSPKTAMNHRSSATVMPFVFRKRQRSSKFVALSEAPGLAGSVGRARLKRAKPVRSGGFQNAALRQPSFKCSANGPPALRQPPGWRTCLGAQASRRETKGGGAPSDLFSVVILGHHGAGGVLQEYRLSRVVPDRLITPVDVISRSVRALVPTV